MIKPKEENEIWIDPYGHEWKTIFNIDNKIVLIDEFHRFKNHKYTKSIMDKKLGWRKK